ncbi:hypothetical protein MMYC01_201423 [Madurella mycetomatis]|uniref:Uncharacterized protein n=1 Tax=Madurella mycetomatis TaxID=100816 RepID=A0A175W4D7_9PEZI|nr:hypothetical protein MMYC01_203479 [Madurella mycetomatis]KXX81352.1 hypothetical protein MMYC01_201423 [Madurella mycetomatis]
MFIEIALVVIAAAALLRLLVKTQPVIKRAMATPRGELPMAPYFEPPFSRVSYGAKPGALVFGWPAKGGVYLLTAASAVEIEFLGYGRFQQVPRPDPTNPDTAADEESHCNKMRQLGAKWWRSEHAWFADRRKVSPYGRIWESFLATGWPAGGGVWVLSEDKEVAGRKGAGRLFNARTMEERCKIIEQLGGTFYANPKDCPDLDLA